MAKKPFNQLFPAPLEVWVGSYIIVSKITAEALKFPSHSRGMGGVLHGIYLGAVALKNSFRPLSRVGWFPTYGVRSRKHYSNNCFRPLSRYGWGPTWYKTKLTNAVKEFPAPLEG